MTDSLEIRPARTDDLDAIADIHLAAFRPEDNFTARLGRGFVRKSDEFFFVDPDGFSLVAVADGQVVGILLGYLGNYDEKYNRYRMAAAARAYLRRPLLLLDFGLLRRAARDTIGRVPRVARRLLRRNRPKPSRPPHLPVGLKGSVALIAVQPDYTNRALATRGKEPLRVADRLLTAADETCRARGAIAIVAGVIERNVASRTLFERHGYRAVKQLADEERTLIFCMEYGDHET